MYDVKISVIMPCYNIQEYIGLSIESVIKQTFTDFELIVVNDGSTDQTESVVKTFTDPRIKYIKLPYNMGNYAARNTGLRFAKGKYLAMLDADDIAKPNRLEIQFLFLEKYKHIGCIGSLSDIINAEGNIIGKINRPLSYKDIKVMSLKDNYLTQSTLMIRSKLVLKHQLYYNEVYRFAGDYDFVIRMMSHFSVVNLNETLVQYRMHLSQISTEFRLIQKSYADSIRISILKYLKIDPTDDELLIHLKLMNGKHIEKDELLNSIDWFNKLLAANEIEKFFNKRYLFLFLKSQLKNSIIHLKTHPINDELNI